LRADGAASRNRGQQKKRVLNTVKMRLQQLLILWCKKKGPAGPSRIITTIVRRLRRRVLLDCIGQHARGIDGVISAEHVNRVAGREINERDFRRIARVRCLGNLEVTRTGVGLDALIGQA
jgi:hypothetical protein